ncbi:tyrosine-type recombinase/integrase [Halococcus sp. PRR34]|uniref:tyrosine-type recombinase/integrase n=1 Tax=Halococcus sp. PRR34 TaxID=3020830 RepID=UPI0023618FE0|nr:tyrosine-type recombinase/integrase [Halococcus sp. PRR34]
MNADPERGIDFDSAVEAFLDAKQKGNDSGNYRALAENVLGRWSEWLQRRGVDDLEDLDSQNMRRYAQRLRQRARARESDPETGITPASARTYYATISGFLTWCVEDERITTNPALARRAKSELPQDSGERTTQQFWSAENRTRLLRFVDKRAHDAIDEKGSDATGEVRDRALVRVLAFSGCRTAEIARDTRDDRRQGLFWNDVDLEGGSLRVLGKTQEWQDAQLPRQTRSALDRHRTVQQPPTDKWPVFPTAHAPTLYQRAREGLSERGLAGKEVETLLKEKDVEEVLREHEIAPPNLTKRSVRRILRELCEEAGIDPEGAADYLQAHGARRGLGDTLYRERGPGAAQRALRHEDPQTTAKAYQHIDAGDLAEDVSDVFENE